LFRCETEIHIHPAVSDADFSCRFVFSNNTIKFYADSLYDPDIISPGRGAEQWDFGSEKLNNPTVDANIRPLDVYYRFAWTVLEGDSINSYN
jgi:hypothetical protein